VTASGESLGVRRVLTSPGLGAFAMITSTRSWPDELTTVSLEDPIDCWGNNIRRVYLNRTMAARFVRGRERA